MRSVWFSGWLIALMMFEAQAHERTFNVPEGLALVSIPQFARQAGVQIVAPADGLQNVRTRALVGAFDVRMALQQLLSGAGLEVVKDDGVVITLRASRPRPVESRPRSQPPTQPHETNSGPLDEVVVLGTYRDSLRIRQSAALLDTLSYETLERTGAANLPSALRDVMPSFNFPPIYAQGASSAPLGTIRPASLRGLSPGETLVLVEGKRRNLAPFVNGNTQFGTGSQSADLDAFPLDAIERVEVLRETASAQYGSDAIAGTVNVSLRSSAHGGAVRTRVGQFTKGDGWSRQFSGWKGLALPGNGFLTLAGEYRDDECTNFEGRDGRRAYFSRADGSDDPREQAFDREWPQGMPALRERKASANAELGVGAASRLYGFANYVERDGSAALPYVLPNSDGNVRELYPDGFSARFLTAYQDFGVTAGWILPATHGNLDVSTSIARSRADLRAANTINASLGAASPTSFFFGALSSGHATFQLQYVSLPLTTHLTESITFAAGLEYRRERYEIASGDPWSWADGGVPILDGPRAGAAAPIGAQGGSGFQATDAGDFHRDVTAGYVSVDSSLWRELQVGGALRAEHYSDFGGRIDGKLYAQYEIFPNIAMRATAGTGFKAPTLGQQGYSSTTINILPSGTANVRTFQVNDSAALVLGAAPLRPEHSKTISFGLTAGSSEGAMLGIDTYQIDIDDRISRTAFFFGEEVTRILAEAGHPGYTYAAYFVNAVDTRTRGVDVTGSYGIALQRYGRIGLSLALNVTDSDVREIKATPRQLAATGQQLLDTNTLTALIAGQPDSTLVLGLSHTFERISWQVRAHRYGHYRWSNAELGLQQTFATQWTVDFHVAARIHQRATLSLGVHNLLDSYPETWVISQHFGGRPKFSGFSPEGQDGAFWFAALHVDW